jgi:hypothetical protein
MNALSIVGAGRGIGVGVSEFAILPGSVSPSAARTADGRANKELGRLALLSTADERGPGDELARLGLLALADDDGPSPPIG